jgi:hypothetical protein
MEILKEETVWADEGGVSVRFESGPNGKIRIIIMRDDLQEGYTSATISNWRWKRIIKNFCGDE